MHYYKKKQTFLVLNLYFSLPGTNVNLSDGEDNEIL